MVSVLINSIKEYYTYQKYTRFIHKKLFHALFMNFDL
jgi:hypothetical protein